MIHVAEQRDLALDRIRERTVGAANQDIRLDPDLHQLAHGVLSGLGLQLAGGRDVRDQREVDEDRVVAPHLLAELPDRLEERQRLDVTHGAADLGDHHVVLRRQSPNGGLDFVGDVWNDLDRAPEELTTSLLGDDREVDAAGCDVVHLGEGAFDEPFVVTQIQIGLGSIVGDEHLTVLVGGHRAGIDVDVRIELLDRHLEAALHEEPSEGRRGDPLPQGRNDAARDEDVFRAAHQPTRRVERVMDRSATERSSNVSTAGGAGPSYRTTPIAIPTCNGRSCSRPSARSACVGGVAAHRASAPRE